MNVDMNEMLNIYFDLTDTSKYNSLFLKKIQPIFQQNIINFLNDFIYQISIDKHFYTYNQYFTNIRYNELNLEKYKAFAITSYIKYITDSSLEHNFRDIYKSLLQVKINNLTYDIYNIAYTSVYNYFYDYLKQYVYLNTFKRQIYNKLISLTNQLIDINAVFEETLLTKYMNIHCDTDYLLIQFYGKDINNPNGYTVFQKHKFLNDAIEKLNQLIEFEFKIMPTEIYYNNLMYSKNSLNYGIIMSNQHLEILDNLQLSTDNLKLPFLDS